MKGGRGLVGSDWRARQTQRCPGAQTGTCAAHGSSSTNCPSPSLRLSIAVHSEWLEQASSSAVVR